MHYLRPVQYDPFNSIEWILRLSQTFKVPVEELLSIPLNGFLAAITAIALVYKYFLSIPLNGFEVKGLVDDFDFEVA